MEEIKPISEIENDAKKLDAIMLKLPSAAMCHAGAVEGYDRAVGFYMWVDKEKVCLDRLQKNAYDCEEHFDEYPLEDIESYQILKRFVPDRNDGIDDLLIQMDVVEAPEGFYDDE
jgi:hypothetical protein